MSSKMRSHHPRGRTPHAVDGDGRGRTKDWYGNDAFTAADRATLKRYLEENPRTWTVKGAQNALRTKHPLSNVEFYLMTLRPAAEVRERMDGTPPKGADGDAAVEDVVARYYPCLGTALRAMPVYRALAGVTDEAAIWRALQAHSGEPWHGAGALGGTGVDWAARDPAAQALMVRIASGELPMSYRNLADLAVAAGASYFDVERSVRAYREDALRELEGARTTAAPGRLAETLRRGLAEGPAGGPIGGGDGVPGDDASEVPAEAREGGCPVADAEGPMAQEPPGAASRGDDPTEGWTREAHAALVRYWPVLGGDPKNARAWDEVLGEHHSIAEVRRAGKAATRARARRKSGRPYRAAERELMRELAEAGTYGVRDVCDLALMCRPVRSYRDVRDEIEGMVRGMVGSEGEEEAAATAAVPAAATGQEVEGARVPSPLPAPAHAAAQGGIDGVTVIKAMLAPLLGGMSAAEKAEVIRYVASTIE